MSVIVICLSAAGILLS